MDVVDQVASARTPLGGRAPTADPAPVLRLKGVRKLFDGRVVVEDLDLSISRGEFFTLLGPSGCGKTTTLRMVAGLERPDGGEIILRDRVVASAVTGRFASPEKRNLGMVFQSYAIWPHMTVFENVAYPLQLRGYSRILIRTRVADVLELVGLAGLEERPATKLSGGQQQRLALCRALVYEPDLVLLDEPFSNLDAKLREQMRVELKSLQQRLEVTVLFVTHDQLEALSLSDRIAVMNLGRVEQVGAPRALYEAPHSPFVRDFLGQNVLLDGRVRDVLESGWIEVHLTDLPTESRLVGRTAPGWTPAIGDRVKLAARPEDVELTSGDAHLPGVTRSALFLGDRYQVHVELQNGVQLLLHAPRTALRSWAPNERVGVRLPADAVMVWPA